MRIVAARTHSLFDRQIIAQAVIDSFGKLNPVHLLKNPVIFVTEIGAALTAIGLLFRSEKEPFGFVLQITLWLWFTVLFANFAEAMAEGRGKAQANALRKTRTQTLANRLRADGSLERVPAEQLRKNDVFAVSAGEIIPSDGEIIEGVATVDESAITGESAPVIREAGGDRSAVTGGTRVLSDQIKVRVTANPGESFLDRMIGLIEGARRQKTPNEVALTILLSAMTIIFLVVIMTLKPFGLYSGMSFSVTVLVALLVCLIPTTIGGLLNAIGIAGIDRMVHSTFFNEGVAFPHVRTPSLTLPFVALGMTRQGVSDVSTEKPIELVFLILSPAQNPDTQVQILGLASRAGQNRYLLQGLRSVRTPEEAMKVIYEWEASNDSNPSAES